MSKKNKPMVFQHLPIEAMLYTGDEKSAKDILKWLDSKDYDGTYTKTITTREGTTLTPITIAPRKSTHKTEQHAYAKEWVVFEDDMFFIYTSETFNERYTQITFPEDARDVGSHSSTIEMAGSERCPHDTLIFIPKSIELDVDAWWVCLSCGAFKTDDFFQSRNYIYDKGRMVYVIESQKNQGI